jgi:hypothetical protein
MGAEAVLPLRRSIVLCVLLGALLLGWLGLRYLSSRRTLTEASGTAISKEPVAFVSRTFDPASPPSDMPPLAFGEYAECDSHFLSNASVGGETRQTDATHATVTITRITVTLQLNITTWLPTQVSQHVIEHEEGHRQISEYYYQTADKIAERIAASYMGRQIDIAGTNQDAGASEALQQVATDITDEYGKELNPEPTQSFYDSITNHGVNDMVAKDAAAFAIRNVVIDSPQPPAPIGN